MPMRNLNGFAKRGNVDVDEVKELKELLAMCSVQDSVRDILAKT